MAYDDAGEVITLTAGEDLEKYRVVYLTSSKTVKYATNNADAVLGVTQDSAFSGGSVAITINGVAKCQVGAAGGAISASAGELVCVLTASAGLVQNAHTECATAASASMPVVGIALENGSNGSYIPVVLQCGTTGWRND